MSVTTEHWQRSLELEFWSKGKERSLIRITAPKKEQDTATLRSGNDLWNFLPKVKRVVKLPSSMLGASWMGSHFSNDDLVKDSRMADDYALSISFRGVRDGAEVIEVTGIPHPDAAVVWGKVVVEVLAADRMPRAIGYYDEQMKLARTLTYHDVAALGGRRLPTRMSMQPADETAESTEVLWLEIAFDVDLPDEMFSLRSLQQ
ncbi:MAG: outer membrane lipoprotein-sorting protein [Deltaproteobacteria bacterium]|nr:outer membrane lipoprotein-sorting protein [Deltaproteobacteria bacterium]